MVQCESGDAISQWMQQLEGEFAQFYNRRKGRSGAFWEDRYHCTIIEEGRHLWNCMVYVELNMVRAGVVRYPAEWPWCSYQEWMGLRRRYRAIIPEDCLGLFGDCALTEFQANYQALISEAIAKGRVKREPQWTESIAVGSEKFVQEIGKTIDHRQHLELRVLADDTWALREAP